MNTSRTVAVLGIGGVGGSLAGVLARAGTRVICLEMEEYVKPIQMEGLRIESALFGDFTSRVEATAVLDRDVDLLVVATKAPHLVGALDRVPARHVAGAVVLPLLNGLEHMQWLREKLSTRVLAGSVRIVAEKVTPTHIRMTSSFFEISLGSDGEVCRDEVEQWASFLKAAGLSVLVKNSEAVVLWDKLARLSALACLTSLTDLPIGALRADPEWRHVLESFLQETVRVATAEGAPMMPEEHMRILDALPPDVMSSMQRDIAAGRPSEIDAIGGAVIRAGARHGIDCPTVQRVVEGIQKRIAEKVSVEGKA